MSRRRTHRKKGPDLFLVLFFVFVIAAFIFEAPLLHFTHFLWVGLAIVIIGFILLIVSLVKRYIAKRKKEEEYLQKPLVENLERIDPEEFEKFVGWIFEREGYEVNLTPRTGDHGIDLLLKKDGLLAGVQVKRYGQKHSVSEKEMRDLSGSLGKIGAVKGFFVTSSDFTAPTRQWTEGLAIPIELINGHDLVKKVRTLNKASWREIIMSRVLKA